MKHVSDQMVYALHVFAYLHYVQMKNLQGLVVRLSSRSFSSAMAWTKFAEVVPFKPQWTLSFNLIAEYLLPAGYKYRWLYHRRAYGFLFCLPIFCLPSPFLWNLYQKSVMHISPWLAATLLIFYRREWFASRAGATVFYSTWRVFGAVGVLSIRSIRDVPVVAVCGFLQLLLSYSAICNSHS